MTLVRVNNGSGRVAGTHDPDHWMNPVRRAYHQDTVNQNRRAPQANILEKERAFVLEMAVPGYQKDAISIKVDKNILTISHDHPEGSAEENSRVIQQEFFAGSFTRSFALSRWVDVEKIEAKIADGLLTIEIPKREEVIPKPAREIAIS